MRFPSKSWKLQTTSPHGLLRPHNDEDPVTSQDGLFNDRTVFRVGCALHFLFLQRDFFSIHRDPLSVNLKTIGYCRGIQTIFPSDTAPLGKASTLLLGIATHREAQGRIAWNRLQRFHSHRQVMEGTTFLSFVRARWSSVYPSQHSGHLLP